MKKLITAICIGLIAAICINFFTGFAKECQEIRQSVLRLHILANSDSEEDQGLKLKVRDRLLQETQDIFYNTASLADAKTSASENIDHITAIAKDEIRQQGYDYPVNVEICNMFFDTRVYDEFTLPAGHYDAVRITIGDAEGKNWWCVLYPPMCLPAAEPRIQLAATLTQPQVDIVEQPQKYKVKFAIVELVEKLADQIQKWFS